MINLDWSILRWIQGSMTCPFLDFLMPKITALGNGGAIWLAAAAGLIFTKKYRKQGILLLGGLAAGVLVGNVFLKNLVARSRPCWLDQSICLLISSPTDYSFPSGHTLSSTIGEKRGRFLCPTVTPQTAATALLGQRNRPRGIRVFSL